VLSGHGDVLRRHLAAPAACFAFGACRGQGWPFGVASVARC
jgi:hypothetical protein